MKKNIYEEERMFRMVTIAASNKSVELKFLKKLNKNQPDAPLF
jgi:hypothetical protein